MAASLKFLKAIRSASRQFLDVSEYTDITKTLKTSAKDLNIHSFASAIDDISFKHVNGAIHVDNVPFRSVVKHLRAGNLACKVISKSCSSPVTSITNPSLLMYAVKSDVKLKATLEEQLQFTINETEIPKLLSNVAYKTSLLQYLKNVDIDIPNPCSYTDSKVSLLIEAHCFACDSSIDNSSIGYVDSSDLAQNMSYECVKKSTILETIAEIAIVNSISLAENLISIGSSLLRYLIIGGSVLILIAFVAFIILKCFSRHNDPYCDENCMRMRNIKTTSGINPTTIYWS